MGKHSDKGSGKHSEDQAAKELGDAVNKALKNAPKTEKPQTHEEVRKAVEGK